MLYSLAGQRAVAQRVAPGSEGILGAAEPSARGLGRTLLNAKVGKDLRAADEILLLICPDDLRPKLQI